jgi:AcrR family transcriptional regulator
VKTGRQKLAGTPPDANLLVGTEKYFRTRARLLDAVLQVVVRNGAEGISFSDIAQAAKVSRGTVYNYFETVEAAMNALAVQLELELNNAIETGNKSEPDPAKRVSFGIRHYVRYGSTRPLWAKFLTRFALSEESLRSSMQRTLVPDLQAGYASGRFSIAPTQLLSAVALIGGGSIAALMGVSERLADPSIAEDFVELVLRALGVPGQEAAIIARLPLPDITDPPDRLLRMARR